ncbi:hypothetical protein NQ315_005379 [Exocentrus adspersus]|uniref:Uncharacterized protein n=1 Tax=Exocentrus adspersus TaxID=1586481 RepID=A0AAV8W399_9CUCU|nr:hypothetical protein NQ315_005379 [Exocentrus adspersus]
MNRCLFRISAYSCWDFKISDEPSRQCASVITVITFLEMICQNAAWPTSTNEVPIEKENLSLWRFLVG